MLPVVLHHGLFGHGDLRIGSLKVSYFRGIDRAITQQGHPLIVTSVHPTSSIANRAAQLKEMVISRMQDLGRSGQKVILMAHSMGGLDARYAVTRLGLDRHVAAIVTITTPHRGSPFADWVLENLGRRLRGIQLVRYLGLDLRAGIDLTTAHCARFNERVPNVPGVKYYSVSAARPWTMIPPFALHSHRIVLNAEGDNDGLVSVKSSTWGEHHGVWKADHWHTINRRWMPKFKDSTGDISPLWVELLDRVKAGLGVEEMATV
jgi:triacylglycerol lipase